MHQRVRQFREASVRPSAADYALAQESLAPPLLALFKAQHERDIVHSARTARWLIDRGHGDAGLIAAALLHDVGKGQQRRRDRVAYVAAGWLRADSRLGAQASRFELRRAVERSRTHCETGAAMLVQANAPERVVDLVRRHHSTAAGDVMLALLQQADAAS